MTQPRDSAYFPTAIFRERMSAHTLKVYAMISSYDVNNDGQVRLTAKHLAESGNISVSTVNRALRQLEDAGFLEIDREHKPNTYRMVYVPRDDEL